MSHLANNQLNKTKNLSSTTHVKSSDNIKEDNSLNHYFDPLLKKELNNIPDRMYFKIGEVAKLLKVNTSVLRYWESEFTSFTPVKSEKKQRMYKRKNIEQLFLIKKLLYRDRFSIEGARAILTKAKKDLKGFYKEKKIKEKLKDSMSLAQVLLLDIQDSKKLFE